MTERDNGGPAFPLQSIGPDFPPGYAGMTLRDWFAGSAMQGELASWEAATDGHEYSIARRAFAMADAMIDTREEGGSDADAVSLSITGPNSDGEYWLHLKGADGKAAGINLGASHLPIATGLLQKSAIPCPKE